MKTLLKAVGVIAASGLLLAGCKKKDEGAQNTGANTGSGSQQQAQTGSGSGQTAANTETPKANIEGCNSNFEKMPEADYTLTEKCSPYTLSKELSVDGWDLTIEPGVEIRFAQDGRLTAAWNKDSRITAKGTAEKPIKFVSGGRKEPGAWEGISLYQHAKGSTFENVIIEHAGRSDHAALEVNAADVHVKNVKVVAAAKLAYEESNNAKLAEFDGNDFSGSGAKDIVASFKLENLGAIGANNKWPEKTVIDVSQSDVDHDIRIPNPGIPYRALKDVNADAEPGKTATITIEPGVVFRMGQDTKWGFGWNNHGGLKALGTAEKPIVFTSDSESPEPGAWHGLSFYNKAKVVQLDYVKIEFGGEKDDGAINYGDTQPSLGKLTHVTIVKSPGPAITTSQDHANFDAFSDNTFQDTGSPTLRFNTVTASKLGGNNTFPADGVIELKGDVHRDVTLTAQSAPYQVLEKIDVEGDSDVKPATVEIQPGATFKFGPEGAMAFGWSNPGVLKAVGAPDKQITFTAATDGWKGLEFNNKGKLQIENAVFEKTAEDSPAIVVGQQATGGTIKAAKFNDVKVPVRDCSQKKLTAEGVKPSKEGC